MSADLLDPSWLKDFLFDRTIYAFAALLILVIIFLTRQWMKATKDRIEDLKLIIPLADKLSDQLDDMTKLNEKMMAALLARRRESRPPPPQLPPRSPFP